MLKMAKNEEIERMEKYATIWRESIYNNDFKCDKCGRKLSDTGDEPTYCKVSQKELEKLEESKVEDRRIARCWCPSCKEYVALITKIEADEDVYGKQGYFLDFIRKKKMS